jgi:hypothetical protein
VSERENLAKQWAETEHDLRAALARVDVGSDVNAAVIDYLDHNELGLAFDTLIEALDQLGTNPSPVAIGHLQAANERMGNHPDSYETWERLRQHMLS